MRTLNRFNKLILLVAALNYHQAAAQNGILKSPLDLKPALSGSFGELRTAHFHSGIDLRTNGKIGFRVYASEKGYVSRIKVSPVGFGKVIYITHPNGLTTVYAHLDRFTNAVAEYVEKQQYASHSFEVELFPKPGEFNVSKGEVIGFSGNSGSSGGPHLHFEVRSSATQWPVSPLKYLDGNFLADNSAPTIKSAWFYEIDSMDYLNDSILPNPISIKKIGNLYFAPDTIRIAGKSRMGFGVEAFDIINGSSTTCGFHKLSMLVNNKQTFSFAVDSFSYAETRCLNSIIDYSIRQLRQQEIVRLWADPGNLFSGLKADKSLGILTVESDSIYKITIELEDFYKNTSKLEMVVKGVHPFKNPESTPGLLRHSYVSWWNSYSFDSKDYSIYIPRRTLYHDILLRHSALHTDSLAFPVISIHHARTPLNGKFTLRVKIAGVPANLRDKCFIGYINGKGIEYCSSRQDGPDMVTSPDKFGKFTLALDTVPPRIIPLNISQNADIAGQSSIKIKLTDNYGIGTYSGFIDDGWVLFEWDPKTSLLTHTLTPKRERQNTWHTLRVEVADLLNNRVTYKCRFYW